MMSRDLRKYSENLQYILHLLCMYLSYISIILTIYAQVAGVFLLLVMSMHTSLWWGMSCHPLLAYGFIIAYYSVAVFCIFAGLTGVSKSLDCSRGRAAETGV